MTRQAQALALVSLLGLIACDTAQINLFGSPTQIQGGAATPTPSLSPTPTPLPGATPDPCLVRVVKVAFFGGSSAQIPSLPVGHTAQLDATPFNEAGQVPDGCNLTRSVTWSNLTPLTCQVVGAGFNPFLRGLRVGSCTLTATVERVSSDPWTVDIR